MIVFSIILTAISSAIMIAMGYTFPYIVLWYYAMKRKTTVKSLFFQIKEHGDLLCVLATSIFLGYFMVIVLVGATLLELVNHNTLSYTDLIFGLIAYPLTLFAAQLCWASEGIKESIDNTGKYLREQSIKI